MARPNLIKDGRVDASALSVIERYSAVGIVREVQEYDMILADACKHVVGEPQARRFRRGVALLFLNGSSPSPALGSLPSWPSDRIGDSKKVDEHSRRRFDDG